MAQRGTVELWVHDRPGALGVDELVQFLIHLRAAYAVAAGHRPARGDVDPVLTGKIVADVIGRMEVTFLQLSLFRAAGSELSAAERLEFLDIGRENPVRIVLSGSVVAIVAAVSFAGGTIDVNGGEYGLKASTPGLAQAVVNIQRAFGSVSTAGAEPKALPAPPVNIENASKAPGGQPPAKRRSILVKRPPPKPQR